MNYYRLKNEGISGVYDERELMWKILLSMSDIMLKKTSKKLLVPGNTQFEIPIPDEFDVEEIEKEEYDRYKMIQELDK